MIITGGDELDEPCAFTPAATHTLLLYSILYIEFMLLIVEVAEGVHVPEGTVAFNVGIVDIPGL